MRTIPATIPVVDPHAWRDRMLIAITAFVGLLAAGASFVGVGVLLWW